jgi:hypothetical protein
MQRPKITRELIAAAAATFCARQGWDAEQAEDLARVARAHMDGYELAKALDSECGWSPTAQDVDTLDMFSHEINEAHRQVCAAWARDNNVQPPLPVGTMTTRGEITGISSYSPACYEIRKPGDTEPTRRYIVPFEDAKAVDGAAVGAA